MCSSISSYVEPSRAQAVFAPNSLYTASISHLCSGAYAVAHMHQQQQRASLHPYPALLARLSVTYGRGACVFCRFDAKCKRIQAESPHGRRPAWAVRAVIVKSGDDCRQELLAVQLISTFYDIFQVLPSCHPVICLLCFCTRQLPPNPFLRRSIVCLPMQRAAR